ncbi:hypothetical protein RIF29_41802 [Crotalaria pallida]|uniref:Uncharacterized protein n=1 Tax=Crotalaria pallida TaxID=3830 RepID=A0AAN9HS01_CROPI
MESISRETLRPFSPTPPHLRVHPLSMIDNILPPNCVPLIYFYPNQPLEYDDTNNNDASSQVCDDKILMLKKSLSKVLSIYYPLAGRLKDKSIECNDQGVSLLVTRTNSNLSKILQNPIETLLNPLFPDELPWKDMGSSASLLAIQINFFACGGIAIGLCMSHKVGDISTLFNFVNDWAALNRNSSEEEGKLIFPLVDAGASILPQGELPVLPQFKFEKQNNTVSRRYSMYEADFGWGKPIWVTTSDCPMKNTIVFMDTRDGNGIEALVNLEEKDMALLERDVELLQYASLSPSRWNLRQLDGLRKTAQSVAAETLKIFFSPDHEF